MSNKELVIRYLTDRRIDFIFTGKLVRVNRHVFDHTFINKCGYQIGRMK